MSALAGRIAPCGPVVDAPAAARVRETLRATAADEGWTASLEIAWPALAPVFAASPYLAALARRAPGMLGRVLTADPDERMEALVADAAACGAEADAAVVERRLRLLKKEVHLVTALADLGGVWDLDAVTGALSRFADAAVRAALELATNEARTAGRIMGDGAAGAGPLPGLFIVAMGKHGAFELNYSSDIDLTVFHEPAALPLADGVEAGPFATRLTDRVAAILQRRTSEGYVFRVDLRLRPDPSSTPAAVSVPAAFSYYESVGQNWERAAFIKARVVAGDMARGDTFLAALQPFVWRRNLDFAAIADIHAIKRQIHAHKGGEGLVAAGADLKLGRGGIREIEFYVQTQQLILGGRHTDLRSPRTVEALAALAAEGRIEPQAAGEMIDSYRKLRDLEHRCQMVADEQTHRLPAPDSERRPVAALA
ncbi:MAG: glutamine-synthetase adenylyltransferase, partial [Caulobacteraceae bacterium]